MAINKLDKAIKLHEVHMTKPATATPKSQAQMMTLMKEHREEMPGGKPTPKGKPHKK